MSGPSSPQEGHQPSVMPGDSTAVSIQDTGDMKFEPPSTREDLPLPSSVIASAMGHAHTSTAMDSGTVVPPQGLGIPPSLYAQGPGQQIPPHLLASAAMLLGGSQARPGQGQMPASALDMAGNQTFSRQPEDDASRAICAFFKRTGAGCFLAPVSSHVQSTTPQVSRPTESNDLLSQAWVSPSSDSLCL